MPKSGTYVTFLTDSPYDKGLNAPGEEPIMPDLSVAAWELLALLDRESRGEWVSITSSGHITAYTELVLGGLVSSRRLTRQGSMALDARLRHAEAGTPVLPR